MESISLADKISSILTTTPSIIDPEDDFEDDTKAKLSKKVVVESDEEIDSQKKLRKQNIDLLDEVDERYVGKGASRKNLNSDKFNEFSESDEFEESESGSDLSNEDLEDIVETDHTSDDLSNQSNDYSDIEHSDQEHENITKTQTEDSTNLKNLENTDVASQVKKGLCVKNQMKIWENLLEMRIQTQKCLIAANKMPQKETYKALKKESGQDFTNSVQTTKKSLLTLLDKWLLLQNLVWKQFPEMKKFQSNKQSDESDENNEEIPSETEEEDEDIEENESPRKKMKLSDLEKELQNKHQLYTEYRNTVIKKWHEKTRMPVTKNNTNVQSIINHIEHTLADKTKLIKRVHLKRSSYKIIGEESEIEDNLSDTQEKTTEIYNSEIFDDDDFYQQQLRELIEFKSADLTDPVQLSKQWIQLQKLRSKMKRKIDTKATKGRKIRYTVHTKLVNFMAPIEQNLWSDEAKVELFGSLFGKNQLSTL